MKLKFITILILAFAVLLSACGKSDADLQKAAADAVKAKAASATVVVKDGVATLSGEVENDAAKEAAYAAAKGVDGITSVTNDLKVKPTPPPVVPDLATKSAVEEALKKKGLTDVSVDATSTEVTIRGTVPKGKIGEAMQIVTGIAKRKINNQVVEK